MMSGLTARRSSYPRPSRSIAPARKFSTITSASLASASKISRPFADFRLRVIVRLLAAWDWKWEPMPASLNASTAPTPRFMSGFPTASILMTSAPSTAS